MVRRDFAEQNPDKVAAYLAVYLRAVVWEKAHREEAIKMMKAFYEKSGVLLPDKYLAREIDTRPTYGLDEQIKLLSGAKDGTATVDKWFKGLGDYLVSTGTLKEPPELTDFITTSTWSGWPPTRNSRPSRKASQGRHSRQSQVRDGRELTNGNSFLKKALKTPATDGDSNARYVSRACSAILNSKGKLPPAPTAEQARQI